ncbi:hypothetical protein O6H91_19G044100 [Diphasiastrum complanatum]|uniref:Uncharacterized protein n=2 Tax=Diphasiastrum complanatum TaxID=34168 RepID=A0ACC2AUN3_DIPCM|nr:hypothetical protein O6H91_19G044100 [Diphasiastrum complanatum]KAJ7521262.1 hypothetical protein O6H91_19G044100 [Diphasiastrum complanatum]
MALLRRRTATLSEAIYMCVSAGQEYAKSGYNLGNREGGAHGWGKICSIDHVRNYSSIHRSQQWWIIDGEIYPIGPNLRPQIVSPNPVHPISKKQRQLVRAKHLSRVRITEAGSQETFWRRYMESFQQTRNEWEKLAWDKPKRDLFDDFDEDDDFFDKIVEKKKKKKKVKEDRPAIYTAERRNKPFSREEIQAAFQEDYRRSFTARSPNRKGVGDENSYPLSRS